MKIMSLVALAFVFQLHVPFAFASSPLEGIWYGPGQKVVEFTEFDGLLTAQTQGRYSNGATSDFFFAFLLPVGRDLQPGEIVQGRIRSVDGYYGCLFDEKAELMLTSDGALKVNFPLLTFHRVTRSVRETKGYHYRRIVDWTHWGWVESIRSFPIEDWRVLSTECVIDQRNAMTTALRR
jgi:hypothetical protein